MHKKQKATKLLTIDEVVDLRKQGLIFKTRNFLLEEKQHSQLYEENESEFCRKMKILTIDFNKYKEKFVEKGEKGLRSILVRHGFRKDKSDIIVNYLTKRNKIE